MRFIEIKFGNFFLKLIVCFICLLNFSFGQSLKTELSKVFQLGSNTIIKNYMSPLSKTFGSILGSSNFHNAEAHSFPHFDFGINLLNASIPSAARQDSNSHVTVFGNVSDDSNKVSGLDMSSLQIPVMQVNFGLGDNTSLFLRYTRWNIEKLGDIEIFGAGIKYELENLFSISLIPFDIGILAAYQKYKLDNYIEGAAFGMNLIGSRNFEFFPIELYAAAGYINNVTNVNNPQSGQKVGPSVNGLEEIRYQLGINYSVLFLNINTEYTFGEYSTLSGGIRVIF